MVNYFPYEYGTPNDGKPFATHVEVGECPWHKGHRLVRVGEWEQKPKPTVDAVIPTDVTESANFVEKSRIMLEMVRLALVTDSTRLVSFFLDATPIYSSAVFARSLWSRGACQGLAYTFSVGRLRAMWVFSGCVARGDAHRLARKGAPAATGTAPGQPLPTSEYAAGAGPTQVQVIALPPAPSTTVSPIVVGQVGVVEPVWPAPVTIVARKM